MLHFFARMTVLFSLLCGATSAYAMTFNCGAITGFTFGGRVYLDGNPQLGLVPNVRMSPNSYVELRPVSLSTWASTSVQFSMPSQTPKEMFSTFSAKISTSVQSVNLDCVVTRDREF